MFCPHCGCKVGDEANFCFNCGYEIKEDRKNSCEINDERRVGCEIKEERRRKTPGLIVASNVFIIISICICSVYGFIFLMLGMVGSSGIGAGACIACFLIFALIITLGIISIKKLNSAMHKSEVIPWAILTLLFCSFLAGIFMLCTSEEDYCE